MRGFMGVVERLRSASLDSAARFVAVARERGVRRRVSEIAERRILVLVLVTVW
jgi:hypothetical protein